MMMDLFLDNKKCVKNVFALFSFSIMRHMMTFYFKQYVSFHTSRVVIWIKGYQGCRQCGKTLGPERKFELLYLKYLKYLYLVEDLLPVSNQCIRYVAVFCCLCTTQDNSWKVSAIGQIGKST